MGTLGSIVQPLTNVATNAAKAGKVKSIKLKVKMQKGDGKKD